MKNLINLDIEDYELSLKEEIKKENKCNICKKLDQIIRLMSENEPVKALELSLINERIYISQKETKLYEINSITILLCLINKGEGERFLQLFKEYLKYAIHNKNLKLGLDYLKVVDYAFENQKISDDESFKFAKYAIDFYLVFKFYEQAISLICNVAFNYAEVRAYQSSYRLLSDAQEIIIQNELADLQAEILFTQGSICILEGDFINAESDLENAIRCLEYFDKSKKIRLLLNYALVKLKTNKYDKAIEIYEELLNEYSSSIDMKEVNAIHTNISICQRELGFFHESILTISKVLNVIEDIVDINFKIEVYLIASNNYTKAKNYKLALKYINTAINLIDIRLESISRLHYRRGFRENYVDRINCLICEILPNSEVNDIINILIFLKTNSFADWLSVLDWFDKVKLNDNIDIEIKKEIESNIENLIEFGTPVLYGFYEKYDDPFDDIEKTDDFYFSKYNFSEAWRRFNLSITKLSEQCEYIYPYYESKVDALGEKLRYELEKRKCYIFINVCGEIVNFILLNNNTVSVERSNIKSCIECLITLNKYQEKYASFAEFSTALDLCINELSKPINSLIEKIIISLSKEVIIVPDKLIYSVPVLPSFLLNDEFREKLKNDEISICYTPILYFSREMNSLKKTGLGIISPACDLPLLYQELLIPSKYIKSALWDNIDLSKNKIDYTRGNIKSANIIHIVSHGFPISKYTDPCFATLAGTLSSDTISIQDIQEEYWKLNYDIVITNACDSANTSSRNYQKQFLTNEIISYGSLFLLNRKSSSITVNWPIKDLISYIFSHLYYKYLGDHNNYKAAYSKSLVSLYDMKKEDVIKILLLIDDEQIREEKLKIFRFSKSEYPFRNPYCYAAFTYTTLL